MLLDMARRLRLGHCPQSCCGDRPAPPWPRLLWPHGSRRVRSGVGGGRSARGWRRPRRPAVGTWAIPRPVLVGALKIALVLLAPLVLADAVGGVVAALAVTMGYTGSLTPALKLRPALLPGAGRARGDDRGRRIRDQRAGAAGRLLRRARMPARRAGEHRPERAAGRDPDHRRRLRDAAGSTRIPSRSAHGCSSAVRSSCCRLIDRAATDPPSRQGSSRGRRGPMRSRWP